jgi:hypothetical protein
MVFIVLTLFSVLLVATAGIQPGTFRILGQYANHKTIVAVLKENVSIMTSNYLKKEPTPETSCVSNIPETMDNVQHSVSVMNRPLSETFRESADLTVVYTVNQLVCGQSTIVFVLKKPPPAPHHLSAV